MSGAFGWSKNNSDAGTRVYKPGAYDYTSAKSAYSAPEPPKINIVNIGKSTSVPQPAVQLQQPSIPGATHEVISTAQNIINIVLDQTSSMSDWPGEIFKRMPTLFNEAAQYFGQSLEILFCAHGDANFDKHSVQISKFAAGSELDDILNSFYTKCWGGSNQYESHELVAYYLLKRANITSTNNAITFFITDEPPCSYVSENLIKSVLGLDLDLRYKDTIALFRALQDKMRVFTISCDTKTWDTNHVQKIWKGYLGQNNVIPLDDYRRSVDVILGTVAKLTNNYNAFTQNLQQRQGNGKYSAQNIANVHKSIALVNQTLMI